METQQGKPNDIAPFSSMRAWRQEKGEDVGVRFAHPNLCGLNDGRISNQSSKARDFHDMAIEAGRHGPSGLAMKFSGADGFFVRNESAIMLRADYRPPQRHMPIKPS